MKNIVNINNLFNKCSSLIYIPDISRWNTKKINKVIMPFEESLSSYSFSDKNVQKSDYSEISDKNV